jgi:bifunctional non-homologous end joining protein LigD
MSEISSTWQIAGQVVPVSNLDKPFWPEEGLTKGDMLQYYLDVAPVMLPYFKDRPVTLRIFPDGIHGFSYYQRDLPEKAPEWFRSIKYHPKTAKHVIQLPLIDNAAGLIWLANLGSIEFHLWGSHGPDLAQPDMVILDLDLGEKASFVDVLQAALRLRETLDRLGLKSYPKTSGGRGLHVYLPLAPGYSFEAVRIWVKKLARQLATTYPNLITIPHGATHQGRQVTIDYAQNSIGRNTAAPYTLRARPGAPVSTPLTWEEVEEGRLTPSDFTLKNIPQRLQKVQDLFAPVLRGDQYLPCKG